jgi:PAS domain-containing protein
MTVSGQLLEQAHTQLAKATAGFFENGSLPMWIYDLSTLAFLAVNEAAAKCYGYSHEEFRAMAAQQLHLCAERSASLDATLSSPFSP